MTLSKYCLIYPDPDDSSSVILFSTRKASIISVPDSMLEDLKSGVVTKEEQNTLTGLGILVGSREEELREMLGFMECLNAESRVLGLKVAVNLDCNLNCIYCFEGRRKGWLYMTDETAESVTAAVEKWAESLEGRKGDEKIIVTFYGGEPLLSEDAVLSLSRRLKKCADENGILYLGYMNTNGSLLTARMAESLAYAGLKEVAVPIDGPEYIHNRCRPFKGGKGSFDAIVKNLREVSDILKVTVTGNYMEHNYGVFPQLLDDLGERGLTPEKIRSIRFEPVTNESEGIAPAGFRDGCVTYNEEWIAEATLMLREEILRGGYKTNRIGPAVCSMDMDLHLLVNYDGSIYKCPGMIGREEFKVGHLKSGVPLGRQPHGRDSWKNKECLDCAYLPLCFGGCRYMKFVRDGDMDGVDCRKPYLDATLETMVRQDVKYGLA
ncbi:MAG: geopeptide radical SAM maturase [Candidatus Sulfobium sp.]|jgi:uncharacterized protein